MNKFCSLKLYQTYYQHNKEIISYLFWGGLTFIVSVGSYFILNICLGINELIANIFSWLLAVLFAFFTNRKWVFHSKARNIKEIVKEIITFFSGRILTLIIEEIILLFFISWMKFNSISIKIVAQFIVIILNYIISKKIVFYNK